MKTLILSLLLFPVMSWAHPTEKDTLWTLNGATIQLKKDLNFPAGQSFDVELGRRRPVMFEKNNVKVFLRCGVGVREVKQVDRRFSSGNRYLVEKIVAEPDMSEWLDAHSRYRNDPRVLKDYSTELNLYFKGSQIYLHCSRSALGLDRYYPKGQAGDPTLADFDATIGDFFEVISFNTVDAY